MKKLTASLIILVLFIFSASLATTTANEELARVGDHVLTPELFAQYQEQIASQIEIPEEEISEEELQAFITQNALEQFILDALLEDHIENMELEVSFEEAEEALMQEIEELYLPEYEEVETKEEFIEMIKEETGMSYEEIVESRKPNLSRIKLQDYYLEKAKEDLEEGASDEELNQKAQSLLQSEIDVLFEKYQEEEKIEINL